MEQTKPAVTPEKIMRMSWGYAFPLILATALEYKLFDLLDAGPKTVQQIASEAGISSRGAKAVLEALAGMELVRLQDGRFELTPESAMFLVSSKPAYHGGLIKHGVDQLLPTWQRLRESVKTGRPVVAVNSADQGQTFFPELVEALFPVAYPAAQLLGEHLGIRNANAPVSVLDIGAGSGVWGIALAEMSPRVRFTAVDWPSVLEVTKRVAARHGVAERLTTLAGDLLEADFGRDHQVAVIGQILHSEGVTRSQALLRKTFGALAHGGVIAIAEFVPNQDRTGPVQPLIFGVNMLVHTDEGDVFTFEQIAGWLKAAGFVNPRPLETPGAASLILATKP